MIRVLLVGGGTAGHVEPALAVGKWLTEQRADVECEFLGTAEGLESQLVAQSGFTLRTIRKAALPRRFTLSTLTWPFEFLLSLLGALTVVRSADVVVGFGGYVSAPAYLAAKLLRTPIIVHEANAMPGWANRLGARFTRYVDIAFAGARNYGPEWQRAELVGMPIRSTIAEVSILSASARTEIKTKLAALWDLDMSKPIIFIFGGSLGARSINSAVAEFVTTPEAGAFTIIHSVGKNNPLPEGGRNYRPLAYVENMAEIYAVANLIISRSGAVSCAEIESVGVPAILVPLPVGNGEQEANAQDLLASGQATVISNTQFTSSWLAGNILATMERAKNFDRTLTSNPHAGAVATIGKQVLSVATQSRGK